MTNLGIILTIGGALLAIVLRIISKVIQGKETLFLCLMILPIIMVISGAVLTDIYCSPEYYRDRNAPTVEDINDGYATLDSIGVVNNVVQYEINWIGSKTGKREQ